MSTRTIVALAFGRVARTMNDRCEPLDWNAALLPCADLLVPEPGTTCTCSVRQRSVGGAMERCEVVPFSVLRVAYWFECVEMVMNEWNDHQAAAC